MLSSTLLAQLHEQWAKSPLASLSPVSLLVPLVGVLLLYFTLRAVYLIYFHPLSSFPGPYQAALSTWWLYGVSKTGHAEEIFEKLHKQYNSQAVRIAPNELHITDPKHYATIYSQRSSYIKQAYFYDAFNTPHSVFVETDTELHRVRRKMLSNFFSKQHVRTMEHLMVARINRFCDKVSEMKNDGVVNLYQAFRCLTIDFITGVAFGESFQLLDTAEKNTFRASFLEAFDLASDGIWGLQFFPILRTILNTTPTSVSKLIPQTATMLDLFEAVHATVDRFRHLKSSGKSVGHDLVFDSMAHLDDRLVKGEASDILAAGSDTTASTLAVGTAEMINNPALWARLKAEIKESGINLKDQAGMLNRLEQLPFLTAVVKESLRCTMAVPGRLPRVVPRGADPLVVDGKVVPPGSIVGISAYSIHYNEDIWGDDAHTFNPDRWLTGDAKELEKYLVTFSKGLRQCIGINLAYAELTLAFAMMADRFTFTRDETMKPVDMERVDNFTIAFRGSGIRAHVHEDKE